MVPCQSCVSEGLTAMEWMQRDFIALYPGRINTGELCPGRANTAVHMQAASCARTFFVVVTGDAVVHGDFFHNVGGMDFPSIANLLVGCVVLFLQPFPRWWHGQYLTLEWGRFFKNLGLMSDGKTWTKFVLLLLLFVHEGLWIGHPRLVSCIDILRIVFVVFSFTMLVEWTFPALRTFYFF